MDAASGNLIVAMGHAGISLRTPDARWRWISLGPNSYTDLSDTSKWSELLRLEIGNALILYFLVVILAGANTPGTKALKWNTLAWSVAVPLWLVSVFTSPSMSPPDAMPDMVNLTPQVRTVAFLVSAVIAVGWSIVMVLDVRHRYPHAWHRLLVLPLTSSLFFFLPYYLWSQDAISQYTTAILWAFGLTTIGSSAGIWYLQKYFKTVAQRANANSQAQSEHQELPPRF